jgi:hypothetical protein
VIGGWRKLHSEELHNLCSLPSIIRMFKYRRMGRIRNMNGEKGKIISSWWENQKKQPLGRSKHKWLNNIKKDPRRV